jgi:hypothetical protein
VPANRNGRALRREEYRFLAKNERFFATVDTFLEKTGEHTGVAAESSPYLRYI